jgi:hypothetical protein
MQYLMMTRQIEIYSGFNKYLLVFKLCRRSFRVKSSCTNTSLSHFIVRCDFIFDSHKLLALTVETRYKMFFFIPLIKHEINQARDSLFLSKIPRIKRGKYWRWSATKWWIAPNSSWIWSSGFYRSLVLKYLCLAPPEIIKCLNFQKPGKCITYYFVALVI